MAKRAGNPNMVKGAPSVNPDGRAAPIMKAAQPTGSTAVAAQGGYLTQGENNAALIGRTKWITYANATNVAIVATGLRYFGNLLAGTEWHADPNEAGGADADRGVEIIEQGLLKAPMLKPWPQVVRKAGGYRMNGASLHATAFRRRPDGMVVYSAIEHRPMHSIEQWLRPNEFSPFDAVGQRARESGQIIRIPLDECFYCVDDTLTDNPDGVGLLRHVIESVRRLQIFELLEGIAYASDLAGTPIGRAPLSELYGQAQGKTEAEKQASVDAKTQKIVETIKHRNRTPEKLAWALLDSATFKGADPDTITAIQKWAIEIIKSETNGLPDIHNVINRELLQIARVFGVEFAMQGGDGKGSYAQHEDKTSMFATNLQTTLNELGWFATNQLARRLIARNGLDPDTCTPTLRAEPVSTEAVEIATKSLANLALAALAPDDPARNVIRKRMRLPPEPERALDLVAPRKRAPKPPIDDTPIEDAPTDNPRDAKPTKKRRRAA